MALTTYSELKAAIIAHLERDDLSTYVDDFIDLAEARHKREVRIREMLSSADLTLADGDRTIALPDDFLDYSYLRILVPNQTSGRRFLPDLKEVTLHELTIRSIYDANRPRFFSVHETIEFDCEADQDYDVELFYYVELTALSDVKTSNALLTRASDVYLYAALTASAPFLMNDERIEVWGGLYQQARDALNTQQRSSRRGGPLVSRVAGATP